MSRVIALARRVGDQLIWSKLGKCSFCIRQSFIFAASAWTLWVGTVASGIVSNWSAQALLLIPSCATLLWVAHLCAFAKRSSAIADSSYGTNDFSRRDAALLFGRAFLGMALATSFPQIAHAKQPCPFGCAPGQQCCVDGYGNGRCCTNCYVNCFRMSRTTQKRLAHLIRLRKARSLSPREHHEFEALVRKYGVRTSKAMGCFCDNGMACNPDNPWCKPCTCYP
jgi:hypothetical protein